MREGMLARRTLLFIVLCLPELCFPQVKAETFSITGRIRHPGKYELREKMRIYDALGIAGGLLDFANDRKIMLIRGTERHYFNLRDYIQRKRSEDNILLEGDDEIVVP